jgi:hypothetical protein
VTLDGKQAAKSSMEHPDLPSNQPKNQVMVVPTISNVFRFRSNLGPSEHLQRVVIDSCEVLFGHGCSVYDVRTRSEIRVEYRGQWDANRSTDETHASTLKKIGSMSRTGSLVASSPEMADSAHIDEANQLQIRWRLPAAPVYARYHTFEQANEVLSELDGTIFDGSRVSVVHHLSKSDVSGPAGGFTLKFEGLSTSVDIRALQSLVKSTRVRRRGGYGINEITAVKNLIQRLINDLTGPHLVHWQTRGSFLRITVPSLPPAKSLLIKQKLHDFRHPLLGRNPLLASYTLTIEYSVPDFVFSSVLPQIERLQIARVSHSPKIHWHREVGEKHRDHGPVRLSLQGDAGADLSDAKLTLDTLLEGELVMSSKGCPLWHAFFDSHRSLSFLQIVSISSGAGVTCESKKQSIRLHGQDKARERARQAICDKVESLRGETVVISLQSKSYAYMLSTGVSRLQRQFGQENIRLDDQEKRLVVCGSQGAAQQARRMVHNAIHARCPNVDCSSICLICMDTVVEPFHLDCGHVYCTDCLRSYLVTSSESGRFPITCIAETGEKSTCNGGIPIIIVRSILSADSLTALWRNAFLAFIRSHPKQFQFCPTAMCNEVYRVTTNPDPSPSQCNSCLTFICTYCSCNYHVDKTCRQNQDASEELFSIWRSNHDVRRCPGCKSAIERAAGCSHIICTSCGIHICWQCMKSFRRGKDVYDHMFREHGSLGMMPDIDFEDTVE